MAALPAPAAFLAHGSPMNTLEANRYTAAWRAFGVAARRPRAVLCISAHWYVNATAVTAMAAPRTIHDFFGFPQALFDFRYPAPGAPAIAQEIADALKPDWVGLDADSWGLDHGTWSVLAHVFPQADVPVIQLSINAAKDLDDHFELGTRLAALRERGILVIGSGDVVHNLRRIDFRRPDAAYDWALRFDAAARDILTTQPAQVGRLLSHPDYAQAVPTPDHFLPMVYFAGLCAAANRPADVLVEGCSLGSISMTSYTLGVHPAKTSVAGDAASLPDPRIVPSEDTNA